MAKRRSYVSTYFSPDRGAADQIIGFIDHCEYTLDVAIYGLTHDGIAAAIVRAHQRGVAIRVLIDKTQAGSRYADDELLEVAGIPLRRVRGSGSGSFHHKFCIGDSNAVISGSFNWTKNADERNAENFMIVRLNYVVRSYQQEFGGYWVDE